MQGKTIVVTGGLGALGSIVAETAAKCGASVALLDYAQAVPQGFAERLGANTLLVGGVDLTSLTAAETAMAAAKEAQTTTAAGCAGMAAFFGGSSLGPTHVPPIPPGEFLTAKAVSGAVIYAAIGKDPKTAPERFQSFVQQGLDVTVKIKLWEKK